MRDKLCSNCVHFSTGLNPSKLGFCNIQLPPWTNTEHVDRDVHADSTCDLHKAEEGAENAPAF